MYQRALTVLNGGKPDRLPFITRLETWYKAHTRTGTLPKEYQNMSLGEVHKAVGVGQLKFMAPYALKLRGVEVKAIRNGQVVFHESEPVIENFPGMWDVVANDKPGVTLTELITPLGKLRLQHMLLEENVFTATEPYLKEHLIKEEADYGMVEYILEHAEYIPRYQAVCQEQEHLGDDGFVVPLLHRIPFQQVLLEYLGETSLFYALHDTPAQVQRLLSLLDEQLLDILEKLAAFKVPYVEFPDNLTSPMTNPRLFQKFCLPAYERYTDILHAQGKKVGSHTDGNLKLLLELLTQSGLDLCESVSPAPLTPCTFEEIWSAWQDGPLIWGGIPTPILEERTSEDEFRAYIDRMLDLIGDSPIILGVVDLMMRHNSIERVRFIAHQLKLLPAHD